MALERIFLLCWICCSSVCSAPMVSVPSFHKALLGSTASLPCTFSLGKSPINHSVLSIIWIIRDKEILRYNKTLTISQPRLTLDVQAIEEGIVSLSVSNVTISDEGIYTCVVLYKLIQEHAIELEVVAVPMMKITRSKKNLYCSVTGFYPVDIGVSWLRDGEPVPHSSNIDKDLRPWSNADGTYTLNNSLSVTPGEGQKEGTYSCQVEHKSLLEPLLKDFQLVYIDSVANNGGTYSVENIAAAILLTMLVTGTGITAALWFLVYKRKLKPKDSMNLSLSESGEVLSCLTLREFYPREIQIRWSCGVGYYWELETIKENVTLNHGSFNIESECKLPGHLFKDPRFKVRVTWNHRSSDEEESRELCARDPDFPWRPRMEEIISPTLTHGAEGKFQCKIWGYFPLCLELKWFRREAGARELIPLYPSEKYYLMMDPVREADGTYSGTAILIVSVNSATEQGVEFICQIRHPSLREPLERSTGPLKVEVKSAEQMILL
ncbi:hypothetical protein XELAEV_18002231mg [Xenopus laevis]|nr:hypothetical protein XELAEV_18002231mg [Xenopus laevis]